jgi:hypothetical protein
VSSHALGLIRTGILGQFRYSLAPESMEAESLAVDPKGDGSGPQEVLIDGAVIPAYPAPFLARHVRLYAKDVILCVSVAWVQSSQIISKGPHWHIARRLFGLHNVNVTTIIPLAYAEHAALKINVLPLEPQDF